MHLVLEHCAGGELAHALGARHYSERTAASYMRAVLRTLAQCHAAGILHRDVKPGNFMLLSDDARAPLKAVDFGLAAFFDPADPKPREDLGLEGTPWYMAPEVLSSRVGPEADLWAAGVMACQLLTGRFPFDDRAGYGTGGPVLSRVWRSILTDKLRTDGPAWEGETEEEEEEEFFFLFREGEKREKRERKGTTRNERERERERERKGTTRSERERKKKKNNNSTRSLSLLPFRPPPPFSSPFTPSRVGVSDDAKAFVRSLLDRDPARRPSALEALRHPWLVGGNSTERQAGRQLSLAVVQRVQRYASASAFRRSVLEMIAAELLADDWNLVIFPEGGRSPDGWAQEFRGGAAYLASRTGRPVVPFHLHGTRHILPKGGGRISRTRTTVTFGTPLWPAEGEDARQFAVRIESAVATMANESTTDWWTARKAAARGETPSLQGPDVAPWRRSWALEPAPDRAVDLDAEGNDWPRKKR